MTALRTAPRYCWLAVLLPLVVLAACGDERKRPSQPTVSVEANGDGGATSAVAGAGGEGPTRVPPVGGPLNGPETPCNGSQQLCERPYDRVTYPVAHAAMANSASFWSYPAQSKSLRTQLDDSIRGLMLEVHDDGGVPALCFGDCSEGHAPLVSELARVVGFLGDNPREVVTLLIDNRVPASEVAQALDDAKLAPYLYQGAPDGADPAWPTLGELIEQKARLVVFLSDAADAPAGYRSLPDYVRATSDSVAMSRDLDCETVSGSPDAPLVLLMQTLAEPSPLAEDAAAGAGGAPASRGSRPSPALAETVNRDPFFSERVTTCTNVLGRAPNFIAVDFYDQSDVVGVTQRATGLTP